MSCGRSWEVRAIDEGRLAASDVASFERHALGCESCSKELAAVERLRALSRQLTTPGTGEPSDLDVRRLRARVLRDAMSASTIRMRRAPLVLVAMVAVAATAAAAVLVARARATHEERAFSPSSERVAIPPPQGIHEPIASAVSASPRDAQGPPHVELVEGRDARVDPARMSESVAMTKDVPTRRNAPAVVSSPEPSDREFAQYARAVEAYRLGRFEPAADLMRAFVSEHPSSPLADDASFIEASSLARAGHADAAARVARDHMQRFPTSFHRKDAAILVERGQRDGGHDRDSPPP